MIVGAMQTPEWHVDNLDFPILVSFQCFMCMYHLVTLVQIVGMHAHFLPHLQQFNQKNYTNCFSAKLVRFCESQL